MTRLTLPPPLDRLTAGLATALAVSLLALPVGPALAEPCDASHIKVIKAFPSGPLREDNTNGTIIQFRLGECDNHGSTVMPRDHPIPFCAEIFDSTPCNANARGCLANNVAGARGVLTVTGIERVGEFKVCSRIVETESFQSIIVYQYNNDFVDVGQNAIFVIMRNPTRHLRIPIVDDD